jgi:hypothetical protein
VYEEDEQLELEQEQFGDGCGEEGFLLRREQLQLHEPLLRRRTHAVEVFFLCPG